IRSRTRSFCVRSATAKPDTTTHGIRWGRSTRQANCAATATSGGRIARAGTPPEHKPADFHEPLGSGRGVPVHRREVGVLWSHRADIAVAKETVEFEARLLAEDRIEDQSGVRWMELFARSDGTFLVYVESNHRCDWGDSFLDGAPPDHDRLRLDDLHERYPSLATAAGLQRVRRL